MDRLTKDQVTKLVEKDRMAKVTINFKEKDYTYLLELPAGRKARNLTAGALSIVTPFMAKFLENKEDYDLAAEAFQAMAEEEEASVSDLPKFDYFTLAMSLSRQVVAEEFEDVADGLLDSLYNVNGELVDIDDEFFGEKMVIYWKLLTWAAKEVLLVPLVSMLGEEGSSVIDTFRQQMEESPLAAVLKKS